jgi:hypothetical protein
VLKSSNVSHFPLFCDTVSMMNLMCRYSPFGECVVVGISSQRMVDGTCRMTLPFEIVLLRLSKNSVQNLKLSNKSSQESSRLSNEHKVVKGCPTTYKLYRK